MEKNSSVSYALRARNATRPDYAVMHNGIDSSEQEPTKKKRGRKPKVVNIPLPTKVEHAEHVEQENICQPITNIVNDIIEETAPLVKESHTDAENIAMKNEIERLEQENVTMQIKYQQLESKLHRHETTMLNMQTECENFRQKLQMAEDEIANTGFSFNSYILPSYAYNFYQFLGLDFDVECEDVTTKTKYLFLACHQDRVAPHLRETPQRALIYDCFEYAREVLSDSIKRARYDLLLQEPYFPHAGVFFDRSAMEKYFNYKYNADGSARADAFGNYLHVADSYYPSVAFVGGKYVNVSTNALIKSTGRRRTAITSIRDSLHSITKKTASKFNPSYL